MACRYQFSDSVVATVGALFTVLGDNAGDSIYPNFSVFW